jgi:hypothetical protein
MNRRAIISVLGAAALVAPTAAKADTGNRRGADKREAGDTVKGDAKRTKKAKKVTFVFKGTYTTEGTVTVRSGNAHVRRGGFLEQAVTFDLAGARLVVVDTNADQKVDLADVRPGDMVVVKARLAKGTKYAAPADGQTAEPVAASQLIDQTTTTAAADESGATPE